MAKSKKEKADQQSDDKSSKAWKPEMYEGLTLSTIILSLSSLLLSSFVLTSAIIRIAYGIFSVSVCNIRFHSDDDTIAWLASTSITIGISRMILSVVIARPVIDKRLYVLAGEDLRLERLKQTLHFAKELDSNTRDVSLLCKSQLCAGMIDTNFYLKTVLVAWQEGLICLSGIVITIVAIIQQSQLFPMAEYRRLTKLDSELQRLFSPLGAKNVSYANSVERLKGLMRIEREENLFVHLRGLQIVYRLGRHNCRLVSFLFATLFHYEDVALLFATVISLFLPSLVSLLDVKSDTYSV